MSAMAVTERQQHILDLLVGEYIQNAEPVSSRLLEKKYRVGISPATLRNEMKVLSDEGLLCQPHTSAGRIPTEKGYRLFVDRLLGKKTGKGEPALRGDYSFREIARDEDELRATGRLAKRMSDLSSSLVIAIVETRGILFREGWEDLLQEPEFEDREIRHNFARFLGDVESSLDEIERNDVVSVYIGGENPFSSISDFSMMTASCVRQKGEKELFALIGPLRMPYQKNLRLLRSLLDALRPDG